MATIVASAGGGNWGNASTWVGGVVPSSSSDVQLNASSGPVTLNSAPSCRSLDCTGYTNTLSHNTGVTLSIGDATLGLSNIALIFSAGMTYTFASVSSKITFVSTATGVQTITTSAKNMCALTWFGSGGSWQLQDNLTVPNGVMNMTQGTLDTNNKTVSAGQFTTNSGTSTCNLGSSQLTFSGHTYAFSTSSGSVTFPTSTAVITVTDPAADIVLGSSMPGASFVLNGSGNMSIGASSAAITVGSITRIGSASKTDSLIIAGSITVSGTVTVTGNSATNRVLLTSGGGIVTLSAGIVSLTNVDCKGITAAGAAKPFSGTSLGDATNNSNITFTTATTKYAVAPGNWSNSNSWSTSSGGTAGAAVPLCQDTVVFNAASGSGSYDIDMPRIGKDIVFTGFTGAIQNATQALFTSYGSLTLTATMIMPSSAFTWQFSGTGTQTITSAGAVQTYTVQFSGTSYVLNDDIATTASILLVSGSFNANNHTLSAAVAITFNNTTFVSLGTGTIALTGPTTTLTNNATTSNTSAGTVLIKTASTSTRTITGTGVTYASLIYSVSGSSGSLFINDPFPRFNVIVFSDTTTARTLTLSAGGLLTITSTFTARGSAGNTMSIVSSTAGNAVSISKTSGIVSCDYLTLKDSTATGGASWYAGANSTIVSNVSGWQLTAAPKPVASFFQLFD